MKKAIIFSVGFAGRAIYRKAKNEYEIIAFIDNNKDISGTKYENISIYYVNDIGKLEFDVILLGGIWYNNMKEQLLSLGIKDCQIIIIPDSEISYSTPMREIATDNAVKKLDTFFQSKNIKYAMGGSALLNALRHKSLSHATDVDIAIFDYKNLEFLKDNISILFPNFEITIKYFEEDSIIRKKGDIRQIGINDDSDEKINLDIFSLFYYGDYALICYLDSFFYAPKYLVEETIKYPYKDFHISIPKNYDQLFTLAYGKDYMTPVKKWSGSDYKCLITREELEKLVNKK